MSVKLLTEHDFEFLSLTGCITGSSESTLVKMLNCWKSCFVCLYGLILYIPSTIFQLNRTGLPGLNQY